MDDVYILRYYPRTIYDVSEAIDMLKTFQRLDFTPQKQPVYIDLQLNMKLQKKVHVYALHSKPWINVLNKYFTNQLHFG